MPSELSITIATESGYGSTVKTVILWRTLFSYTCTSRHVRPGTNRPLLSFTVNGTSTEFTLAWSVNWVGSLKNSWLLAGTTGAAPCSSSGDAFSVGFNVGPISG